MESRYKKILTTGIMYGLILGIAVNINVQILTWLGLGLTSWVFGIDLILLVITILVAHSSFKKSVSGTMLFFHALLINFVILLITKLLQSSYLLIYINFIEPGWLNKVIQMRTELLVNSGAGAQAVEDLAKSLRASFSVQNMLTIGVALGVISGMVFTGIITIFTIWIRNPSKSPEIE